MDTQRAAQSRNKGLAPAKNQAGAGAAVLWVAFSVGRWWPNGLTPGAKRPRREKDGEGAQLLCWQTANWLGWLPLAPSYFDISLFNKKAIKRWTKGEILKEGKHGSKGKMGIGKQ